MLEIIISIISIGLSIMSLVISIILANYHNKEYEYETETSISTDVRVESYQLENNIDNQINSDSIRMEIINKNNLEKAYLIYPNNFVKYIDIEEVEEIIEESLNKNIELEIYDLVEGHRFYQYRFLFLIGSDDSYNLYLIYTKKDGEKMIANAVSGIEIWGLANSNKDNPEYEGERIMAEKYKKILEESSNYIK